MLKNIPCPECGGEATLKSSKIVYNRDYGYIYLCTKYPQCDSYVGVTKNSPTFVPLGTPANKNTRKLRMQCHAAFDPLWKSKQMTRKEAYKLLRDLLDLPAQKAHIAMLTSLQCESLLSKLKLRPVTMDDFVNQN